MVGSLYIQLAKGTNDGARAPCTHADPRESHAQAQLSETGCKMCGSAKRWQENVETTSIANEHQKWETENNTGITECVRR